MRASVAIALVVTAVLLAGCFHHGQTATYEPLPPAPPSYPPYK